MSLVAYLNVLPEESSFIVMMPENAFSKGTSGTLSLSSAHMYG